MRAARRGVRGGLPPQTSPPRGFGGLARRTSSTQELRHTLSGVVTRTEDLFLEIFVEIGYVPAGFPHYRVPRRFWPIGGGWIGCRTRGFPEYARGVTHKRPGLAIVQQLLSAFLVLDSGRLGWVSMVRNLIRRASYGVRGGGLRTPPSAPPLRSSVLLPLRGREKTMISLRNPSSAGRLQLHLRSSGGQGSFEILGPTTNRMRRPALTLSCFSLQGMDRPDNWKCGP